MVEAWRSGGVPLLDSTGLARVFITSLLLFAIAICLLTFIERVSNDFFRPFFCRFRGVYGLRRSCDGLADAHTSHSTP